MVMGCKLLNFTYSFLKKGWFQAALEDTRIPRVEISTPNDGNEDPEIEIDDDPSHSIRLDSKSIPIWISMAEVKAPP
jgi:hypothetical protein